MADLPAQALVVTNLVSASGAVRLQTFIGNVGTQYLKMDLELTAAQNAALSTALAAVAGTITSFQIPAGPAVLTGVSNAS